LLNSTLMVSALFGSWVSWNIVFVYSSFVLVLYYNFTLCCNCRVAVVGNVDAGKSTLLGVLTHAELDNGRGYARQKLFRHKHEMESGRTSSVGNDILGFDSCGVVVNKPEHGSLDWVKICEKASKVCFIVMIWWQYSLWNKVQTLQYAVIYFVLFCCLECFDTVRWVARRTSGPVLVWLSVWS